MDKAFLALKFISPYDPFRNSLYERTRPMTLKG